jgi:predicted ArsR family transcriptional regulator
MVRGFVRGERSRLVDDFLHFHLFASLPHYLRNLIGEAGASNILIGATCEAIIQAIHESKLIKKIMTGKPLHEVFLTCYKIYEQLGYHFKAEKVEETKEKYITHVIECPHRRFTKKNPIACNSCLGIKQGMLHELLGYFPVINVKKRMAVGDKCCEFEVLPGKRQELLTI